MAAYDITQLPSDTQSAIKAGTPNVGDEYVLSDGNRIQRTSDTGYVTSTPNQSVYNTTPAVDATKSAIEKLATYNLTPNYSGGTPTPGQVRQFGGQTQVFGVPNTSDQNWHVVEPGQKNPFDTSTPTDTKTDTKTGSKTEMIPGTTTPSTGNSDIDAALKTHSDAIAADKAQQDSIRTQISNIATGGYMSPENQAIINQITSTWDLAIQKQENVNRAVLAGVTAAGVRGGRSRYAPEIATSEINATMQQGVDKLNGLAASKAAAIAKATKAMKAEDYAALYKEMDNLQKAEDSETKAMTDLLKQVQDQAKAAADKQKAATTNLNTSITAATKFAQAHAYNVYKFIQDHTTTGTEPSYEDIQKAVQEYVQAQNQDPSRVTDLDPELLLNEVNKIEAESNKTGSGVMGQFNLYKKYGGDGDLNYFANNIYRAPKTPKAPSSSTTSHSLTSAQYSRLGKLGVDNEMADKLTAAILKGSTLEDIRTALRTDKVDTKVLDYYDRIVGIQKLLNTSKVKQSSSQQQYGSSTTH